MGSLIEGAHIKNIAEKGGVCSRGRLIGGAFIQIITVCQLTCLPSIFDLNKWVQGYFGTRQSRKL